MNKQLSVDELQEYVGNYPIKTISKDGNKAFNETVSQMLQREGGEILKYDELSSDEKEKLEDEYVDRKDRDGEEFTFKEMNAELEKGIYLSDSEATRFLGTEPRESLDNLDAELANGNFDYMNKGKYVIPTDKYSGDFKDARNLPNNFGEPMKQSNKQIQQQQAVMMKGLER